MAKLIEIVANTFINPATVASVIGNGSKSDITLINGTKISVDMYAGELVKKLNAR
jgi:hypothetical protein